MPLTTTEDYLRALHVTKQVIDAWDPYRLLAGGAPHTEFEAEAASVVRFIPTMRTPEDVARAVSEVFSAAFEPGIFGPENCRGVAARLFDALPSAGLLVE